MNIQEYIRQFLHTDKSLNLPLQRDLLCPFQWFTDIGTLENMSFLLKADPFVRVFELWTLFDVWTFQI